MDNNGLQPQLPPIEPIAPDAPVSTPAATTPITASPNPTSPPLPPTGEPPQEEPKIETPKAKKSQEFKKYAGVIAGGIMMLSLAVGGVWYSQKMTEQKQTVESRAAVDPKCAHIGNVKKRKKCDQFVKKQNETLQGKTTQSNCTINNTDFDTCSSYDPNYVLPYREDGYLKEQVLNSQATKDQAGWYCGPLKNGGCPQEHDTDIAGYYIAPNGNYYPIIPDFEDDDDKPKTSPSLTNLSCVDLTSNNSSPASGDTIAYTCEGNSTYDEAAVAMFRYNVNNGNYTESEPIALNEEGKATYEITINQAGSYSVQCRICRDASLNQCTAWGQAK